MNTLLKTKKAMLAALVLSGLTAQAQAAATVDLSGTAATTGLQLTKDYDFSIASGFTADLSGFFKSGTDYYFGNNYGFIVTGVALTSATLSTNSSFTMDILNGPLWIASTYTTNFSASNLVAGNYTLTLTGTSYSAGSSFSGAYVLNTTPVPEPESYALMMMGLGLLGLIARRKA